MKGSRRETSTNNRYCSCGCLYDLYTIPEEDKKTSVTKCTNCSELRLLRCQGYCRCRRMCYCLICLGNRKCGDESKECTLCLRRIDTDHFLNGDGCQCKRKLLEQKNLYKKKLEKLRGIIGLTVSKRDEDDDDDIEGRSARRGRSTRRIDDSEDEETEGNVIGDGPSAPAETSIAKDPSNVSSSESFKSKISSGIGVGPSTSADISDLCDDDTYYDERHKERNVRKRQCKCVDDYKPIAKEFIEEELPRFQSLILDIKQNATLVYTLQQNEEFQKYFNDLKHQITQLIHWNFSDCKRFIEANKK